MNTCGTCKHFGDPVTDDDPVNYVPTGYHICRLITEHEHMSERTATSPPALVVDASGYYAALCITEEFGCNQWAEKQPCKTAGGV
jgi:hypothetical protein